ncbi:HD domain-containing protein [Vibrio sp. JC009]|uniref:HD-GYP domain-containing protein n=1 Tax=Vibrio sp. JC009 TaxID=2912314 RepID=UPI0023B1FED2|nr:HD domain-containing phosphohydrolase [Vibrio sp. JC009]WED24851.1 HD domain-containing protein [Vibrio sp. JC009]
METQGNIEIDLRHALLMIARALDYVGIDDINHSHRVAYMAYECAKRLGWEESKAKFAYYTGLVHDSGVSSTDEHSQLVWHLEPEGVREHCVRGHEELKNCPLLEKFAVPVLYHHTQWQELLEADISDYDRDISAIVYLADRLDFLRNYLTQSIHHEAVTLHAEIISEHLNKQSGTMFEPGMVDAMCELVTMEGFWYNMDPSYIELLAVAEESDQDYCHNLPISEVIQLAKFIARIVDAKSTFTYQHSEKVALLATMVAEEMGLSKQKIDLIYVAGLMHDIGKLRTPDNILHKESELTKEEFTRIRRHTVDTEYTLRSFFHSSDVSVWAANHHERLDGSGYPYHKTAEQLDLPSRIIAVADIFQALSQERPYRQRRYTSDEIIDKLTPLAENDKIDTDVLGVIKKDPQKYYQASVMDPETPVPGYCDS